MPFPNLMKIFPLCSAGLVCAFLVACKDGELKSKGESPSSSGSLDHDPASTRNIDPTAAKGEVTRTSPSAVASSLKKIRLDLGEGQITQWDYRHSLLDTVAKIKAMTEEELRSLLAFANVEDPPDQMLIRLAYVGLAGHQPLEALDFFIAEANRISGSQIYYGALETIASRLEGKMVKTIASKINQSTNRDFLESALKALLKIERPLAKTLARELDLLEEGGHYLSQYYGQRSLDDFEDSLIEVGGEKEENRKTSLISIANRLSITNPEQALKALKLVDHHPAKADMINEVYGRLLQLKPQIAVEELLKESQANLTGIFKSRGLVHRS